ncbi:Pyoverdine ABC transporter ATP-binding/permease protein [Pseudomonas amygdali pv. ulmi]|uniref:Pyoverdine ABC transporter ATP-binding/permease protein n=1 Tax=Pseudomonas amygdali pv. ulmi TaxID=251720 RepID=A0A0Q0EDX3_PSEA0|nr:Pyoverdine ABC transporter ATP-binding/permease protein [Pseudomonas amygdali pv. ulmi]
MVAGGAVDRAGDCQRPERHRPAGHHQQCYEHARRPGHADRAAVRRVVCADPGLLDTVQPVDQLRWPARGRQPAPRAGRQGAGGTHRATGALSLAPSDSGAAQRRQHHQHLRPVGRTDGHLVHRHPGLPGLSGTAVLADSGADRAHRGARHRRAVPGPCVRHAQHSGGAQQRRRIAEALSGAIWRIQRKRRQHMLDEKIHGATEHICRSNIRAANIFVSAETFGSMLFFAVIGIAIAFQAMWPTTEKTVLGGFVLVMLYMKGPLERLITALPGISRAQIAMRRIAELSWKFSNPEPHLLVSDRPNSLANMQTLELHNLRYDYPPVEGSDAFHLGPVDLSIKQGDMVFIVGENGCGKTTLIKLLLGLYTPQQGEIRLNGQTVTPENLDDYRQLFTTIFADYYLFDEPLQGQAALPQDAGKYLERLDIAHKVSIKDGAFTTTDLSTGQRKRLALINAWLDERQVLVFDEWAADQDPAFRRVFYTELLPELKQQGKTIIVISHDDRYFYIADQLVRMQTGQIQVEQVQNDTYDKTIPA